MSNAAAGAGSGQIKELTFFSNHDNREISVADSTILLNYYESILDASVRAQLTLVDTGYREGTEDGVSVGEKDDLDMTSGEKVHMRIEDGYGTELKFIDDKQLRINGDPSASSEAVNKMVYRVNLYSKESIDNMNADNWVYGRYNGNIPNAFTSILKNSLKTPKNVFADPGLNSYNFLGHAEKPFYLGCFLAKKCVPNLPGALGKLAGYLFYETYDGFNFRSIDMLFMQEPKKRLLYNQLIREIPEEYDAKILDYSFTGAINLDNVVKTGALTTARKQKFDRFMNDYSEDRKSSDLQYSADGKNNGGLEKPKLAKDIGIQDKVTRNVSDMADTGILVGGNTLPQQIRKSQKENFNYDEIVRQSMMRYNQLYSNRLSILIVGDFSLRAGDLVYCDFPEVSGKTNKVVSQKVGGIYMIADVCHRITKNDCYTRLNLVRDAIYRKPFK